MIFEQAGFTDVKKYRYWHAETRSLDFSGMCEDLAVKRALSWNELIVYICSQRHRNPSSFCTVAHTTLLVAIQHMSNGCFCRTYAKFVLHMFAQVVGYRNTNCSFYSTLRIKASPAAMPTQTPGRFALLSMPGTKCL